MVEQYQSASVTFVGLFRTDSVTIPHTNTCCFISEGKDTSGTTAVVLRGSAPTVRRNARFQVLSNESPPAWI